MKLNERKARMEYLYRRAEMEKNYEQREAYAERLQQHWKIYIEELGKEVA